MKSLCAVMTFLILVVFSNSLHSLVVIDSDVINSEAESKQGTQNLIEIVESNPDLSTFIQAINESGLRATLESQGPWTVFAPSNEAFAAVPQNVLHDLMKRENASRLATLLKNHIVKGSLVTSAMNTSNVVSVGGKPLHIEVRGSQVDVNGAGIVQADITGTNGVIQVVDKVLF